ncbi:hypothetical protein Syun_012378 [Stephania yunnanensis]|uniref:Acyl-CoA oxidase C-alpha1 domain-containing protein n=1 Tax=Stephania yunnanensis TaxID=152371 RepID=A0AAP0JZB3_9MAGN
MGAHMGPFVHMLSHKPHTVEHKKNMGIIEKMKEIEAEMARTQKNKATGYATPIDSSNYRSAKVPLETFVRISSTCFDLVIDYKTQQSRLFPLLASAYAFRFVGEWLKLLYADLTQRIQSNDFSTLPETHACIAGLKSHTTSVTAGVLGGKYDDLSEQSFYMVGGIEEVIAKAEKIAKEAAA